MSDLLRFARRYMLPYGWWYALGLAALAITNWLSVTIPVVLAEGVDALVDDLGDGTVMDAAIKVAAMGVVVIAIRTLSRVMFFTPGRLVEAQVKRDLFASMLAHQPGFLRQWPTGDLFSRVSSDVNMLRLLAGFGVLSGANVILAVGLAGTRMVQIAPELAWYLLGPVAVSVVAVQLFIRRMFILMRRLQVQLADLSDHILASYKGVATIQGFVAEGAFLRRFDDRNERYLGTMLERAQIRATLGPTLALAASVNVFLLLYIGGPMAIEGDLTVGELVAFTALVNYVTFPLRTASFLLSIVKQAQASLERIERIRATEPERPELPSPALPPDHAPTLTLKDLTFTYPRTHAPVLKGIELELPAGATLGVLGLTGSGKTTLLRVLSRLYNPPPGTVFVDGVDLTTLDLGRWREVSTLVPQRPFLFSESIADNILLGADDPERLDAAIRQASLAPDLDALPERTDTLVGESGVRLSGGQRQRTALARGLARQHHLLLLDDVLSAVDHATEAELIGAIRQASGRGGVTTVIVSHRVSALQHADLVLVLDEGQQVDLGPPDALQRRPGLYRDTWEQQQKVEA